MSDKKLLNENTIRRFMKLANVDTMTNNFISERYTEDEDLDENNAEEEVVEEAAEDEMEVELGEQPDMGDMDDMGAEEPAMAMEEGDADISLTEEEAQLLIDLGARLEAAIGDEEAPEMNMDDEPAMDDEPVDDEPVDDIGAEDEPEDDAMMQEDIVNEVLKRVTQRIIKEKMKRK